MLGLCFSSLSFADDADGLQPFYLGGSLGFSSLKPDDNGTRFNLTDDLDFGLGLCAGLDLDAIDFLKYFRVQLNWHQLGNASLKNRLTGEEGDLSYRVLSTDIERDLFRLGPFIAYGAGGLSFFSFSDQNLAVKNKRSFQIKAKGGLDWPLNKHWTLRGEAAFFSGDASFFSLGIIRRFDRAKRLLEQPKTPEALDSLIVTPRKSFFQH